jgi:hypothetical protein
VRLLRAVTMVVELVSFMASTSKFWFMAILHVWQQGRSMHHEPSPGPSVLENTY